MTPEQVKLWLEAAVADGWSIEPTYKNESVERAAKLKRDGWTVLAFMRPADERRRKPEYGVNIWGPDKLAVSVPETYSMNVLERALRICSKCGAEGETVCLGFADRVCRPCRVKLAPTVERRGWCD